MARHPDRGTMAARWRRRWENSQDEQRLRRQFNPMFHMREPPEAASALIPWIYMMEAEGKKVLFFICCWDEEKGEDPTTPQPDRRSAHWRRWTTFEISDNKKKSVVPASCPRITHKSALPFCRQLCCSPPVMSPSDRCFSSLWNALGLMYFSLQQTLKLADVTLWC